MSENQTKLIKIDRLLVNNENPRHEQAVSEKDAIEKLLNTVGKSRMLNLAEDIAKNGLLESQLPIVCREKDQYLVMDGNRRISAIKILRSPNEISLLSKSDLKRIAEIKEKYPIPESVLCLITSKDSALKMISKIHSGEDEGRGFRPWGSPEKARFRESQGNTKEITDLLLKYAELYYPEISLPEILPITSVNRVLNKTIRKRLGLDKTEESTFTKERVSAVIELIKIVAKHCKDNKIIASRLTAQEVNSIVKDKLETLCENLDKTRESSKLTSLEKAQDNNNRDSTSETYPISKAPETTTDSKESKSKPNKNTDPDQKNNLSESKRNPDIEKPYFFEGLDLSGLNKNIQEHQGLICLGKELLGFSRKKLVNQFPLATVGLLRSFIENVFVLYTKSITNGQGESYYSLIVKNGNDLSKFLNGLNQYSKDLIPTNIKREFKDLFSHKENLLESLNLTIHRPDKYRISEDRIVQLPQQGLLTVLNCFIHQISESSTLRKGTS